MTKQQLLANPNDTVKAKRKDRICAIAFALFVVVPLVAYITDQLAK
ncbi:hypothetical protein [Ralstonia phage RSF1]|uniref:Uncharacterized protein n=1 Tax=Ralstonia phage RSF1 TaxID=1689679 RepID=A0A146I5N1_9CAUD|nr:hypothetical protein AVU11_agp06 [Ralstonia phage RSF1]BAU71416.1 hypothetical protein [Ralstonia phage RSF1]